MALMHQRECPACRRYVASLRGLAAILPPLILRGGVRAATAGAGAGLSTGALSSAGTAGVSGASGGWALAGGSLTVKLATCLAVLGIGAGCLALTTTHKHDPTRRPAPVAQLQQGDVADAQDTAFSAISSAGPFRRLTGSAQAARPGNAKPRARIVHHEAQVARARGAHRVTGTLLAAEAEFGPEHPHSVAELVEPEPKQPVTQPASTPSQPAPTVTQPAHSPGSETEPQPEGEFGFEADRK
jgi:hypothetical protein